MKEVLKQLRDLAGLMEGIDAEKGVSMREQLHNIVVEKSKESVTDIVDRIFEPGLIEGGFKRVGIANAASGGLSKLAEVGRAHAQENPEDMVDMIVSVLFLETLLRMFGDKELSLDGDLTERYKEECYKSLAALIGTDKEKTDDDTGTEAGPLEQRGAETAAGEDHNGSKVLAS